MLFKDCLKTWFSWSPLCSPNYEGPQGDFQGFGYLSKDQVARTVTTGSYII